MPYQKPSEAGKRREPPPASKVARKAAGLQGVRLGGGNGSGSSAVSTAPAMAQGGPAVTKPVGRPGLPPKLSSEDITKALKPVPAKTVKATTVEEKDNKPPAKKAHPRKSQARKADHSGDPRYTTPPFVNKSGTGGGGTMGSTSESRADKIKRLNAKAKQVNAEHRASRKAGGVAVPSGTNAEEFRKRRGDRTDRRK